LKGSVDGRSRDLEEFGEIGDGAVAGVDEGQVDQMLAVVD
jgi:hypothetical protein